jgi:hypothetical protein
MSQDVAAQIGVLEEDTEDQVYLSPARVLARSFRLSRDKWKQKYQNLKRVLKRNQVQLHDVRASREIWRERAESAEQKLLEIQSHATSLVAAESKKN